MIIPKMWVGVLDLDSLTSDGEVLGALKKDFPDLSGEFKVILFVPNQSEQRKVVVD